jgi:hypothetical protein
MTKHLRISSHIIIKLTTIHYKLPNMRGMRNLYRILLSSVVDPHYIDADPESGPDSTYHPDADPDADLDSNFLFDADPDPDPNFLSYPDPDPHPSFKEHAQTLEKVLK